MGAPHVIAHRGAHGAFGDGRAENTLAAFERAVALGADGIELDVRRSADGELVIFHDARCRGRLVGSLSWEALCDRSGRLVPRLPEVLEWASARGVGLDVELKEGGYVDALVPSLTAFAAGGGELIVTSFLDGVLASVSRLAPELECGLLLRMHAFRACARAQRCGATALVIPMALTDRGALNAARTAGLRCLVWDFIAARHRTWLADSQIDGVITDDVAGARTALADWVA